MSYLPIVCCKLHQRRYPLQTWQDTTISSYSIGVRKLLERAKRPSPFKDGVPGPDWWRQFLKRWPSLSERKPQHLSAKRVAAGSPEVLESWFATVENFLRKHGLLKHGHPVPDFASRIWNADETGFCLGASSKKILARKGGRSVHEVGGASDHQFITVNESGFLRLYSTRAKTFTIHGRREDQ